VGKTACHDEQEAAAPPCPPFPPCRSHGASDSRACHADIAQPGIEELTSPETCRIAKVEEEAQPLGRRTDRRTRSIRKASDTGGISRHSKRLFAIVVIGRPAMFAWKPSLDARRFEGRQWVDKRLRLLAPKIRGDSTSIRSAAKSLTCLAI
jgi:hypothetical protein